MTYGIMFHHFSGGNFPEVQGSISADDLHAIIAHIGRDNILSAPLWREKLLTGTITPSECCLTFDDALLSQFEIALPVLESYDLTAMWFIPTSVLEDGIPLEIFRQFRTMHFDDIDAFYAVFFAAVNLTTQDIDTDTRFEGYLSQFPFYSDNDRRFRFARDILLGKEAYEAAMWALIAQSNVDPKDLAKGLWMNEAQLKHLADHGHVLGLHSHTHPTAIADLSKPEQHAEYAKNAHILRNISGAVPNTASHPCNSYNDESLKVLGELGIEVAFCSNMTHIPNASLLEIPREDHANIMSQINA